MKNSARERRVRAIARRRAELEDWKQKMANEADKAKKAFFARKVKTAEADILGLQTALATF